MVRRQAVGARRAAVCLLLALGLTAALSFRLARPALHTDEITYMGKVLASLAQGSVLPVRESGGLFFNKPPLALWLMRLSFAALGPSPFSARLPSVLAAAATAVVIYLFAAGVWSEAVGLTAALFFALVRGSLTLHGLRSATPDALEILVVTCAIVCLEVWRRRRRRWALAGLATAAAASAWVKSPFAIAVVLVYFLATEALARRAGVGTPRFAATLALVTVASLGSFLLWLGTVKSLAPEGTVSKTLLRQQYLRRLKGQMTRQHLQGAWFYGRCAVDDFGPFLLLPVGAAAAVLLRRRRPAPLPVYDAGCLVAWSLAAPALASLSASKLPWYIYLSYPGVALLLATSAGHLAALSSRRWVRGLSLAAVVAVSASRLPAERLWPREAQHPVRLARFRQLAPLHPEVAVRLAPGLSFGRGGDRLREARFYVASVLWLQTRRAPAPASCVVRLANDAPASDGNVVELLSPAPGSRGLYLIDDDGCGRGLLQALASADG